MRYTPATYPTLEAICNCCLPTQRVVGLVVNIAKGKSGGEWVGNGWGNRGGMGGEWVGWLLFCSSYHCHCSRHAWDSRHAGIGDMLG